MDRGAWWATVQGVAKSWTQLSMHEHTHTHTHTLILSLHEFNYMNIIHMIFSSEGS